MKEKYIEFLKEYGLYDEKIFNYIESRTIYVDYLDDESIEFIGCYPIVENDILTEVKLCVPRIVDDISLSMNIPEYIHLYNIYSNIGSKYIPDEYEEFLPVMYELEFLINSGDKEYLDYYVQCIRDRDDYLVKVLNLFAYTGGATVACLSAGASVCHVDSSKGMTTWAKENVASSNLQDKPVRFIVDDVVKFVNRELRRGNKYDAIIMDPPSYGRGAKGEVWQFENNIYDLVELCSNVLSENPLFFLINSYTTGISSTVLTDILEITIQKKYKGRLEAGEIGLPMENSNLILPCGIYGRFET